MHRRWSLKIARILALGLSLLPALSIETAARQSGTESEAAARPPAAASPVASTTIGNWTALAFSDGRIVLLDLRGETRREWKSPIRPVRSLAIDPVTAAPSGQGSSITEPTPSILAAGPGDGANGSIVVSMKGESGETIARVEVPGEVVHLLVGPGGRKAFVVTGRAPAVASPRPGRDDRWSIAVIDLTGDAAPTGMGIEGPVLDGALSPEGDRIYLACPDRIRTFNTGPLRSSWQFRSPGRNRLVVPYGTGGDILVARGSQIARLNPDKLPGRDPNTGSFPTDDAMMVIPLPFEPAHLSASARGDLAAALDGSGTQLALLDITGGRLLGSRDVPPSAAAILHTDRDAVVMLSLQGGDVSELRFPSPRSATSAGAKPAEALAAGAASPAGPYQGSEPNTRSSPPHEPAAEGNASAPEADASAAGGDHEGKPGSKAPPETPAPTSPAPPAATAAEREPAPVEPPAAGERPAAGKQAGPPEQAPQEGAATPEPVREEPQAHPSEANPMTAPRPPDEIRGRILGEASLVKEVVFYGPNSILKEKARVVPRSDGTFSLPLPPPGKYRILLTGAGGAQLSYSPAYYQIDVASSSGVSGIDFKVVGTIPGHLVP